MVDEISPLYYAKNKENTEFSITGQGFEGIPEDAIGIFAYKNDDPLEMRYTTQDDLIYDMEVESDNAARFVCRQTSSYHSPNYLGAIVSADRSAIYWVNRTKPLP